MAEPESEDFCYTVVEVATDAGLNTLLMAATEASLVETLLEFEGTIFAPTEEAFVNALKTLNLTAVELLANMDTITDVSRAPLRATSYSLDADLAASRGS